MGSDDRPALALVVTDVVVIGLAGLAGILVDLARPGRRWTRRRYSARSPAMLGTCALGVAGLLVLAVAVLPDLGPRGRLSLFGLGPTWPAIVGALLLRVSRKRDGTEPSPAAGRRSPC